MSTLFQWISMQISGCVRLFVLKERKGSGVERSGALGQQLRPSSRPIVNNWSFRHVGWALWKAPNRPTTQPPNLSPSPSPTVSPTVSPFHFHSPLTTSSASSTNYTLKTCRNNISRPSAPYFPPWKIITSQWSIPFFKLCFSPSCFGSARWVECFMRRWHLAVAVVTKGDG